MFVYQSKNFINIVKGTMPEDIPGIQAGFDENGNTVVRLNGADVLIPSTKVTLTQSSMLDGVEVAIPQPNAKLVIDGTNFRVLGELEKTPEAAKAWGYANPDNVSLFAVTVEFDGYTDAEHFKGVMTGGVTPNKEIDPAKFDGPNYITYVLSAEQTVRTIKYTTNYSGEGTPVYDKEFMILVGDAEPTTNTVEPVQAKAKKVEADK